MPDMTAVVLHPDDNICVAVDGIAAGAEVVVGSRHIEARQDVPPGHKLATAAVDVGQPIRKYGQIIGFAGQAIAAGNWVHTHNVTATRFERDHAIGSAIPPDPLTIAGRTFMGYRRADGRAGTRNYIAVISASNCSASVSRFIAERLDRAVLKDYPNIDGVIALTHETGCGIAHQSAQHDQLVRVLAGFARHPNVGGYLLTGLGCEVGQLSYLVRKGGLGGQGGEKPPPMVTLQQCGGTPKTVEAGVRLLAELLPRANDVRRTPIPAAELVVGTNCGGSDGNSGITANAALGVASDMIVAAGGTTVLAETPEIFGAEHLLTRRARDRRTGEKILELLKWWHDYTGAFGQTVDENPAPGNYDGGITTLYEKSLGAIAKAGSTALRGVYRYAEPITEKGFVFMDSPGYDPVSVTGLVASGANLICFTTGRGSCYGCKPSPTIKIASNTPMYEHMIDDMDVDAGVILGGTPVEEVGRRIFDLILDVAGGRKTKSELHGIGDAEFCPWDIGPTF